MRRQGLAARPIRRRRGLNKQDKGRAPFPDLIKRDFTASTANQRRVGDMAEIPLNGHRKLYPATVIDLYSRRLLAVAVSKHTNRNLARSAIRIAVTARGGGHTRSEASPSTPTADRPTLPSRSRASAGSCTSRSRWALLARALTTLQRGRSSPAWSGRSSPEPPSVAQSTPKPSCPTGAAGSTATSADTPTTAEYAPSTTRPKRHSATLHETG